MNCVTPSAVWADRAGRFTPTLHPHPAEMSLHLLGGLGWRGPRVPPVCQPGFVPTCKCISALSTDAGTDPGSPQQPHLGPFELISGAALLSWVVTMWCPAEQSQTCSNQRTANTFVRAMAIFSVNVFQKGLGIPWQRAGLLWAAAGTALALSKGRCERDAAGGRRWQRHKMPRLERGAGKVSPWTDFSLSLVATLFILRRWECSLRHSLLGWEAAALEQLSPRWVVGDTAEAVPASGLVTSAPGQATGSSQSSLTGAASFWGLGAGHS